MKKLWLTIIAVLITFGLIGCACSEDNPNSSIKQSAQSSQTSSGSADATDDSSWDSPEDETDGSGSEEDGFDTENSSPSGNIVPPITDGGNFNGTV